MTDIVYQEIMRAAQKHLPQPRGKIKEKQQQSRQQIKRSNHVLELMFPREWKSAEKL